METAVLRAGDGDTFYFLSLDGEHWYEVNRLPESKKEVREARERFSEEGQKKRGMMLIRATTGYLHWHGAVEFGEVAA